jgi:hypothetical protein
VPGYAPDLNADEAVWHDLKQVELRNISCHDLTDLRHQLRLAITRWRPKPQVVRSFRKQDGY